MKIIDISWPITESMTAYKNNKVVEIISTKAFEKDGVREHKIILGTHTGTHVDAPSHFLDYGCSLDQISLDRLVGPCKVLDLTSIAEKISANDLETFDINEGDIILLKTKNSSLSPNDVFNYDFIYLDKSGAEYLANKNIKSVGIDYLGIERNQKAHETHAAFLQKGILVIEGLRLEKALSESYTLYCLPLPLEGVEAAPVRAILLSS